LGIFAEISQNLVQLSFGCKQTFVGVDFSVNQRFWKNWEAIGIGCFDPRRKKEFFDEKLVFSDFYDKNTFFDGKYLISLH